MCHGLIVVFFMEGDAGRIRISDAGTDIADVLCCQIFLQLLIKKAADTTASNIQTNINGGFHGPVVGRTPLESGGVSITYGNTVFLGHQIRVTGKCTAEYVPQILLWWERHIRK